MMGDVSAVVATMMSAGEDLDRYGRRLAARVNQGSMHLHQVISRGSQVYPVRNDVIGSRPVVLDCEFRPRRHGSTVDQSMVDDLLARLEGLDVSVVTLFDADGAVVGRIGEGRVAG